MRPKRLIGDRGYSSRSARSVLRWRGVGVVIPSKKNHRRQLKHDRAAYRRRNRTECCIGWLKRFRRIATRYEKRAENYLAMLHIAAALYWIRFANTA